MKTELEMAKEGEFLREYGKNHFVAVSEALNIGRVKWNMVPIGKNGQGDIAFYLTTEQMTTLCTEILNGEFAKKVEADKKNPYPKAYAYMTGEDGSLHLAIGGGNVGCRIQMRNMKVKPALNYIMAVSIDALNTMARKYMLCTGATPVMPGTYYASVVAAFEAGRVDRSKFRKPTAEELGEVVNTNSVIDESVESALTVDNKAAEEKPVMKKEEPKTEAPIENYTLTVKTPSSVQKGFYVFGSVDENGNAIRLLFRKEDADKLSWFAKFANSVAGGETPALKISGTKNNDCVLYKGPAKK